MERLMTAISLALRQRRVLFLVALLCFLAFGLAPQASAAGSGFFSPTGSMSTPRTGAVAAPLPDGRVLVAGGGYAGGNFSSAEIFAPVSCRGKQATKLGTDGADQITGTRSADVIAGLGGNDRLFGLAGKDVICGAKGNDTIKGGAGNDQLSGQKGNDKLYGQKGNDKLSGKGGSDTLKGGPGKDILKGGPGKDKQVQ
jgi:Ca2+-binding RTX toxin-like protein